MRKNDIYKEFQRIAAEVVGENRKAQKYYVMQMCEMLGKVDHKKTFVIWCSKKRCVVYQRDMVQQSKPQPTNKGTYYLFRNNADMAERVSF